MRERLHGPDALEVATGLASLAHARSEAGDLPGAEALLRRSLDIRRRRLGDGHPDVVATLYDLGIVVHQRGNVAEGRRIFQEAVTLLRALPDSTDVEFADRMVDVATVLHYSRDYEEAEGLYRRALAIRRRLHGDDPHPATAGLLLSLSQLLRDRRRLQAADSVAREGLTAVRALFPGDHSLKATGLLTLGRVLHLRGLNAEADTLVTEALAITRRLGGPEHFNVIPILLDLGRIRTDRGAYPSADSLLHEALVLARRVHGPESVYVGRVLAALAQVGYRQGQYAEARQRYEEALGVLRKTLQPDHPTVGQVELELGDVLRAAGDCAGAVARYRTASRILTTGPQDESARQALDGLAACGVARR
jgi:tetratricopeptide (TPR) repeat protein